MVLILIVYGIVLSVFAYCPFLLQLVGFGINSMVPDPIPFLDEFIMVLCMVNRVAKWGERVDVIFDFKEEHPILFWIIGAGILFVIICVIIYIYNRVG